MKGQYISVAKAAERRGVARQTIYNAISAGRLSYAEEVEGAKVLRISDVDSMEIYPPIHERKGVTFPGGRGRPKCAKEDACYEP